jgi:hypothetical protein
VIEIKDARAEDKPKPKPRAPSSTRIRQPRPDPEPQPMNRSQAIQGLFGAIALPLAVVQPADAAAIALHSEPIGDAVAETAANDPRFAALVDRLVHAGPYAALLGAVAPLVLQLMANHGYAPIGLLGTMSKDDLMGAVMVGLPDVPPPDADDTGPIPPDAYQAPAPVPTMAGNGGKPE